MCSLPVCLSTWRQSLIAKCISILYPGEDRGCLSSNRTGILTHVLPEARRRRRKCEVTGSGSSCLHCSKKGLPCSLSSSSSSAPTAASAWNHLNSNGSWNHDSQRSQLLVSSLRSNQHESRGLSVSSSPEMGLSGQKTKRELSTSAVPDLSLQLELVNLYFDYVHDQFHSLFHPPTFREDVECRRAPLVIVYAMMALSAR